MIRNRQVLRVSARAHRRGGAGRGTALEPRTPRLALRDLSASATCAPGAGFSLRPARPGRASRIDVQTDLAWVLLVVHGPQRGRAASCSSGALQLVPAHPGEPAPPPHHRADLPRFRDGRLRRHRGDPLAITTPTATVTRYGGAGQPALFWPVLAVIGLAGRSGGGDVARSPGEWGWSPGYDDHVSDNHDRLLAVPPAGCRVPVMQSRYDGDVQAAGRAPTIPYGQWLGWIVRPPGRPVGGSTAGAATGDRTDLMSAGVTGSVTQPSSATDARCSFFGSTRTV